MSVIAELDDKSSVQLRIGGPDKEKTGYYGQANRKTFVLSAAAYLLIEARILGSRSLVRDAIVAVLFALVIYWLFDGFLTVDLPNGPLPF